MAETSLITIDAGGGLLLPAAGQGEDKAGSLVYWIGEYWRTQVFGSPAGTMQAKRDDLQLFLGYFLSVAGDDRVDNWTPSVTRMFRSWLLRPAPKSPPRKYAKAYAPTSVNRFLATLRHLARHIQTHRQFPGGFPFDGVKDVAVQPPEWNGLTDIELTRLRAALDQVCMLQVRGNQRPERNRAIFTLFLHTGLRAFELIQLQLDQYAGKYLRNVIGKGNQVDDIYLSTEARRVLEHYIDTERGRQPGALFLTNRGRQISRSGVHDFFTQIAAHANAKLPAAEHIHLHAHKLRHTSVKRVHDDRGPLAAKKFSRHRSFAQLERYATATREEHERMVDELFD